MEHILVFTDFSPVTMLAFDQAVEIASRKGAKITICHILEQPEKPEGEKAQPDMGSYLKRGANAGVKCESCVCTGDLYTEAASVARRLKPDMAATGTHGSAGIGLKTFGSAIHKLVSGLPVPTLLLGKEASVTEGGYKQILVPAGPHDSFVDGVKSAVELLSEMGEIVLYTIRKGSGPTDSTAANMDRAKRWLDSEHVPWRYEVDEATPHSIGFAAQTLEYMRKHGMRAIAIPSEVSKQNRHFGKLDKEAVLLNEDGFHVLCV